MLFDDIKKSFICFDDFIRDFIKFNCLYIHFLCSVLTSRYMFISMKLNKELHNWCFREQKKGKSRFRNYCDFLEISAIFLTGEEVSVLASLASFISLAFVSPPFFCHYFFSMFYVHFYSYLADIRLELHTDFPFKCLFSPSVYYFYVWLLASVQQYYVLLFISFISQDCSHYAKNC